MKSWIMAVTVIVAGFGLAGCNELSSDKGTAAAQKCSVEGKGAASGATCPVQGAAGKDAAAGAVCPVQGGGKGAAAGQGMIVGTALQVLPAGNYIYVEVDTKAGPVWLAAMAQEVAKGDKINCRQGMLMENFASPVLKRTFAKVYFVESLSAPSAAAATPSNHRAAEAVPPNHPDVLAAHAKAAEEAAARAPESVAVTPAAGGVTIAGIAEKKADLKGREVLLRGKVTKFSPLIMGANWLHVKDSSARRDLVVTTKSECGVGDTVLIKGKLECDVDLGSGYFFDIIIRNAEVTAEK